MIRNRHVPVRGLSLTGYVIAAVCFEGKFAHAQPCQAPLANLTECPPCPASPKCRSPRDGYKPSINGCGPAKFSSLIERGVVPQGYGAADFRNGGCPDGQLCGCNQHDVCWGTCNANKSACDNAFHQEMRRECFRKFRVDPKRSCSDPLVCDADLLGICLSRARLYFNLVSGSLGKTPFEDAQKEACQCCESSTSMVYCACNKKCYLSGTACLAECKAGLGCFTGICGPATAEQCPAPP